MTTYFLIGDSDVRVLEPDDDFTSLPFLDDATISAAAAATSAQKVSESDSGRASILADNEPPENPASSKLNGQRSAGKAAPIDVVSWVDNGQVDDNASQGSELSLGAMSEGGEPSSAQSLVRPQLSLRLVKPDYTLLSTQFHATTAPSSRTRSKLCTVL